MALDLKKIQQFPLPETQYYKAEFEKKQIVLHHTVSGNNGTNDITYWKNTPERVATCVVVERDGEIIQCFSSKHWAHHLGVKVNVFTKLGLKPINEQLNKQSIGIEIDSWGGLTKVGDKFISAFKQEVPKENVIHYPNKFRGYEYFEKYTPQQIQAVEDLLIYWSKLYNIPLDYDDSIFDISKKALTGEKGLFTHCSYLLEKSDIHPQPEMIEMLKNVASKVK